MYSYADNLRRLPMVANAMEFPDNFIFAGPLQIPPLAPACNAWMVLIR